MTFVEFFARYWWLMFPIFGMALAFYETISSDRRTRSTMDVIRSYVQQGKEPPPELLALAARQSEATENGGTSPRSNSRAWTFVIFAALAAGFGTGYYWVRAEEYAYAFLIVAVTMSVLALGALFILIFGRK